MELPTSMFAISADLNCELDDQTISIRGTDRRLVVEVPDVATGLKLLRLGSPRGTLLGRLRKATHFVEHLQVVMELKVADRVVGEIQPAGGNMWGKILGFKTLGIHPASLTAATFQGRGAKNSKKSA